MFGSGCGVTGGGLPPYESANLCPTCALCHGVNTYEQKDIASLLRIQGIPALALIKDGRSPAQS